MTNEEHAARHAALHEALDELIADYLRHAPIARTLRDTSVLDLMNWSATALQQAEESARAGG